MTNITAYGIANMGKVISKTGPGFYFALFTTVPYVPAVGIVPESFGIEVSGASYARTPSTLTAAGVLTSDRPYPSMPGVDIAGVAVMDAVTVGNMWFYYTFPASVTIAAGDRAVIAAGSLTLTFS